MSRLYCKQSTTVEITGHIETIGIPTMSKAVLFLYSENIFTEALTDCSEGIKVN